DFERARWLEDSPGGAAGAGFEPVARVDILLAPRAHGRDPTFAAPPTEAAIQEAVAAIGPPLNIGPRPPAPRDTPRAAGLCFRSASYRTPPVRGKGSAHLSRSSCGRCTDLSSAHDADAGGS